MEGRVALSDLDDSIRASAVDVPTDAREEDIDRIVTLLSSENQNVPLGEVDEGDSTYLVRSHGQFENLDQIANLVVLTRDNVPVYLKDIAEVKDTTEERRSLLRVNGKPGACVFAGGAAA